jgi:hypothetical protein
MTKGCVEEFPTPEAAYCHHIRGSNLFWDLNREAISPNRHQEKVMTIIIEGEMVMTIGMDAQTVTKEDVFIVSPNTSPSAHTLDDRVIAVSGSENS